MNLIYIMGKIISEIKFEFIINNKNKSIAIFEVELLNKSIIRIKAYNENADYCLRNLEKYNNIIIEGKLNSNLEIILKNIKKLEK